jgi:hypothetical protein
MINNTAVENKHPTKANIDTVYPITFSGATDSGGLPMFKVTLTYADGSSKELEYNVDYKLVYDDVQENNNESFNKPHLNGIKFLLPKYAVAGNTLYILRTTPFVQPVDFQIGRIDPEQIEKVADLSVLRDQEIRNQADKDRADISGLYDITAGLRTDVDTAQDSADAAMAHSVAVEKRVSVNETGIATNKSAAAKAQKTADDAMAHSVALEKRVAVNETGIATNKSAAARAQKTADDAMAHTVAVEKRVTQAEKNITSNDVDIANIFSHQNTQDGRLTNLENSKIDKDQGINNVGKVMTVGGDGIVVPKASHGGSGIGVVAHDETLVGAGTDEYPLGVKNKVTITIVEH